MMWPWKKRYDEGAQEITGKYLKERFGMSRIPLDRCYLALREDRFRALVGTAHRLLPHSVFKPDFPDCDDAARLCVADVIREAISAGLRNAPAFGIVEFTKAGSRVPHQDTVAVFQGANCGYYDPISCLWRDELGGSQGEYFF